MFYVAQFRDFMSGDFLTWIRLHWVEYELVELLVSMFREGATTSSRKLLLRDIINYSSELKRNSINTIVSYINQPLIQPTFCIMFDNCFESGWGNGKHLYVLADARGHSVGTSLTHYLYNLAPFLA